MDGRYQVDPVYGGPEYETAGSLGSVCGIGDLEAVAMGNQLCNAYGLDTIGTGVTIAWAMECFERGLIGPEDTGGLDVRFGNADVMVQLVENDGHNARVSATCWPRAACAQRARSVAAQRSTPCR